MTWPTTQTTNSLDADTDTLQNARPEVKGLADKFNLLVAHVTAFMQGLLSSATAADARTTLDVPSRNGVGATGTSWGIGITGNAATATTATNVTRSVTGAGLATGGGALTADQAINVPKASQAQAEAGTDDATAMTPLRVKQAIAALSNPMPVIAAQGVGGIGTYAFCRGFQAEPGSLYSGGSLNYTGGVVETVARNVGAGTWRCMGYAGVADRGTLYLRVA